jgi:hypothetical protein
VQAGLWKRVQWTRCQLFSFKGLPDDCKLDSIKSRLECLLGDAVICEDVWHLAQLSLARRCGQLDDQMGIEHSVAE